MNKNLLIAVIVLSFILVGLGLFYLYSSKPRQFSKCSVTGQLSRYGKGEIITSNPFFATDDFSNFGDNGAAYNLNKNFRGRTGVVAVHPQLDKTKTFITQRVYLEPGYKYALKVAVADIAGWIPETDGICECMDGILKIKVLDSSTGQEEMLLDCVLDSRDDWQDFSFDISKYAGKTINITAEGHVGGPCGDWCGEWVALDYFYVEKIK